MTTRQAAVGRPLRVALDGLVCLTISLCARRLPEPVHSPPALELQAYRRASAHDAVHPA